MKRLWKNNPTSEIKKITNYQKTVLELIAVKTDSVMRISAIFLLKRFDLGPYDGFTDFFVFAKIYDGKVRKSHVCVVNDYAKTQIFL